MKIHTKVACLSPVVILASMMLISCSGSEVSSARGNLSRNLRIALAPSGGLIADALGVDLFNRGFTIYDTNEMSNMFVRLNMSEMELSDPKNLSTLQEKGIDAIMHVKASGGYDGKPQSISIRVNSTADGKIIAGLSWQNGWGGQQGSILDRSKRKDVTEAAREIVDALVK
jgi:hypothetical protein